MKCFCLGPDFTGFPWQYYSNSARRREYKQILYEKLREWIEESGDKKKIFISNLLTEADWDIAGALMHISVCDHTVSESGNARRAPGSLSLPRIWRRNVKTRSKSYVY